MSGDGVNWKGRWFAGWFEGVCMEIRRVTAIIRSNALEKVEKDLQALGVPGMSVSKVKGYGEYADFFSPNWMVTHVRVEVLIGQHRVDEIVRQIMDAAHTGMEGDGIVAVSPVESVYSIRTREFRFS
jgi:nitrogen regulatory protein P-II 1